MWPLAAVAGVVDAGIIETRGNRSRITDHFSPITSHQGLGSGVGRGLGVGPDRGVGVGLGVVVAVAVGVAVAVAVGVGVGSPVGDTRT